MTGLWDDGDPVERLRAGLVGFAHAKRRNINFWSLTEACWWAIAVDDQLVQLRPAIADARDQDGLVVAGMKYPRNMLGHGLVFAAKVQGGLVAPLTAPLISETWLEWRSSSEMPEPERRQPRNQSLYDSHVAGTRVEDSLTAAGRWLKRQVDEHFPRPD